MSRKKLAQIIDAKEGYKLPVVNNITTKFELEFAGQEENLKFSKMKVEEEIEEINQAKSDPCFNKKVDGLYQLNKLIIESLKEDLINKVRTIENSILELSRFKQTYLEKELKEHVVPFNINSLIFSDELQSEIKNKQVESYLLNHDLIRDLKSVRSNCEHKLGFIRQEKEEKKAEEKSSALFFDCFKQVQQIVHRSPKLLRPQALKKFYANFKEGFQNFSKQTSSYTNGCNELVSKLTSLTNELTEMQKKYERSLMRRSKKIRSQSNFIDRSKLVDAIQEQLYVLPSNNMNQLLAQHEICIKKIANLKECKTTEQKGLTLFRQVNNNQKKLQKWMAVFAIVDEAIMIFARLISKTHIQSECHAEMNRLMVACSLIPHAQSSRFKVEE
ncbi:MAG: hypothetical protein HYX60_00480, partial [Legionella longbeachae]|nr:hypothetical protein [Legionella longbeachae]